MRTLILCLALLSILPACTGRHTVDSAALGSAANQTVDFDSPDYELLATAIEQLTNSVRTEHGVPPVQTDRRLRKAAATYAAKMVDEGFLAHEDPNTAALRTPAQRVAKAGIRNPKTSENIADIPGFPVASGEPFFVLDVEKPIIARKADGPPIEPHTYGTLAASVVEGWMNSPGHRRNLLDENALQIGVGSREYPQGGIPAFVVVQVFQLYEPAQP